jgi:hypothetical protein
MPKSLIAMVVIVVLVAVAASAVTYVVTTRGRNEAETGQQEIADGASPANNSAADPRGRTLRRPSERPVARAGERPAGKRHRRLSDTPGTTPSADSPSSATGSTLTPRVRRTPGSTPASPNPLTPEDARDARERSLYRLPSVWRIRVLEASADESLHPTDAQRKEIDSVTRWLQEESKERLADTLDEQKELQGRLNELYRQRAAIQKEIDGKFIEAIRGVMSPEQMAIIEGKRRAVLPHPKDQGTP